MASGLFILMKDNISLLNSIKNGIYGFFMPPVYEDKPNSRSKHFSILADYACCENGTEIFFFNQRNITYGGVITSDNNDNPVFYLNGDTSPLGRKANSEMYIDLTKLYEPSDKKGTFDISDNPELQIIRSMPFVIEFSRNELTGKQIKSDELYFKLGNYNFPFPSNSIQNRALCTLTSKETEILKKLLKESNERLNLDNFFNPTIKKDENKKIFNISLLNDIPPLINEAHLEFYLLANKNKLNLILQKCLKDSFDNNYYKCRQIPLCPFRPMQFDLADICLYYKNNPVKEGSLPNVIIELKKDKANFKAYNQVVKYLRWIKQIAPEDFENVHAIIIASDFTKNLNLSRIIDEGISEEYINKIILYSFEKDEVLNFSLQKTFDFM